MDRYAALRDDPAFVSLRDDPEFQALIFELAGRFIEKAKQGRATSQPWLMALAQAHIVRNEIPEAIGALERAVERGGPLDERARSELSALRARSGP